MKTMEIRLPRDFDDAPALQGYFRINERLARRTIAAGNWLRVKEAIAMRMMADPRFQGTQLRESGDVTDCSWWMENHAETA